MLTYVGLCALSFHNLDFSALFFVIPEEIRKSVAVERHARTGFHFSAIWLFGVLSWVAAAALALCGCIRLAQSANKKSEPNQPLQRNASAGPVSNFQSPARRG